MSQCWQDDPDDRPTFADIVDILAGMGQNDEEVMTRNNTADDRSKFNITSKQFFKNNPEIGDHNWNHHEKYLFENLSNPSNDCFKVVYSIVASQSLINI